MIPLEELRQFLSTITDPESGRDLVSLGAVRDLKVDEDRVFIELDFASQDSGAKDVRRSQIAEVVRKVASSESVVFPSELIFVEAGEKPNPLPMVRSVIAVGAGKGGVGKARFSALGFGFGPKGRKVGILDGDITAPPCPPCLVCKRSQKSTTPSFLSKKTA